MHKLLVPVLVALLSLVGCAGASQTSTSVGPSGSVIGIADGLTLSVPGGALPEGTPLTIRDLRFGPGDHELDLEPAGVRLASPATLTLSDDQGVELEAAEGLEVEHAEGHSTARISVLGHVSIRAPGGETGQSHTRKSCKWVLVSTDPVTGANTWVCSYRRP